MSEESHDIVSSLIETLEDIEANLLEYEQAFYEKREDVELVHHIFRYAHNLKSSLAMVGFSFSSALVHAVESNFDLLRKGLARPNASLFYQCLLAVDRIRTSVVSDIEDATALQDVHNELEIIAADLLRAGTKVEAIIDFALTPESEELLRQSLHAALKVFQIEKLINPQRINHELYATLPIYNDVREIGTLIAVHPSFEMLSANANEAMVRILFATSLTEDEVALHIFDPCKPVHTADREQSVPDVLDQPSTIRIEPIEEKVEVETLVKTMETLELYLLEYDLHVGKSDENTKSLVYHILQYAHSFYEQLSSVRRTDAAYLISIIIVIIKLIHNGSAQPTRLLIYCCLTVVDFIRRSIFVLPDNAHDTSVFEEEREELTATLKHLKAEFTASIKNPPVSKSTLEQESIVNTIAPANKNKLQFLIADDDRICQVVLKGMLGSFGTCTISSDGRMALDVFERHLLETGQTYDLVCLDVMMPYMNGVDVLTEIRRIEHNHHIYGSHGAKIMMTTALSEIDQVFFAFRQQCDAYVVKPITKSKILYQLQKFNILQSNRT